MPRKKSVKGTAEAAKKEFCDVLYVTREGDGDGDYYFCASDGLTTIEDTEAVAIYRLEEVRRKVVTHDLI